MFLKGKDPESLWCFLEKFEYFIGHTLHPIQIKVRSPVFGNG